MQTLYNINGTVTVADFNSDGLADFAVGDGWQVNLTTYKLGDKWHTKADNVSPGAALARIVADTREDAEARALARARELLSRTLA